ARAAVRDGRPAARLPALEWLLARARRTEQSSAWRQWLLASCQLDEDVMRRLPAGPCAHAAMHGVLPSGTWACARPVHLLTGLDHLQLSPAHLDLDATESTTLLADINRHLDGTGYRFHLARDDDWLLECDRSLDCTTVEPTVAAGCNLRELMPGGRDGAQVRSLINELQMLLHEHPVNGQREQRGVPVANSLWLWGFGAASPPAPVALPPLYTDDPWLAGLWRAHGSATLSLGEFAQVARERSDALLGWSSIPAPDADACLVQAESAVMAPAKATLESGGTAGIDLLVGESAFAIGRRSRLAFWKRSRPLAEVLA
ncbi:MAG: hypothetical protein WBO04_17260, partial [Steroidobacteraceae bacterium]